MMSSMRLRNSGAKVRSSALRYSICGAACSTTVFDEVE